MYGFNGMRSYGAWYDRLVYTAIPFARVKKQDEKTQIKIQEELSDTHPPFLVTAAGRGW